MYDYDRRYAGLYRRLRLLIAMSMADAKAVLGFPPGANPSPAEVNKAFRQIIRDDRTLHPDHGGNNDRMVELNIAKDILDGKRREDRFPFRPAPTPKQDPEAERREQEARNRRDALQTIAEEAKKSMERMELALQEADFAHGRIALPSYLTNTYGQVLDKLHDEIEADQAKTPDVLKALALIHTLTGMSVRLAARAAAMIKRHGEAVASMLGMGGDLTFKGIALMHQEMAKFTISFHEFYVESGKLMALIRTSELVPLAWDDTYWSGHRVIVAFEDDFKRHSDYGLKTFEHTLKLSVQIIEGVLFGFGHKNTQRWQDWRLPGDFMKAAEIVKATAS